MRSGSANGSGASSTPLKMLKTAVVTPMPSAKARIASVETDRERRSLRTALLMSSMSRVMGEEFHSEFEPRRELQLARRPCGDRLAEELRADRSNVVDVVDVVQHVERVHGNGHGARVLRVAAKHDFARGAQVDAGIAGA